MMRKLTVAVLLLSAIALSINSADARGGSRGGRVHYGGGHHTSSHGGHYSGGSGSSHRGGSYTNSRTGNLYGTHK